MDPSRFVAVAPGVRVATSRFYAQTSTVVLDGHGGALVVDPAYYADELAAIPPDLAALGARAVVGVATHKHYDHVLWHPGLGDVPRLTTPGTVEQVEVERTRIEEQLLGDGLPPELVELAGRLGALAGHELDWRGPTVLVHVHHAHAPHHLALELPDLGVLVAGDMLSDVELPMPDDADVGLVAYREGLESLGDVVRRTRVLIPGHGSVSTSPVQRWDADRRYVDDLIAGRRSDDPRVGLEGMTELHESNLRLVAEHGAGD